MRALSRKEHREVDRRASAELGIAPIVLMENAGAGAARIARRMLESRPGRVLCVCGTGGNAGDALVLARHLAIDGVHVEISLVSGEPRGDAATELAICRAMKLPVGAWPGVQSRISAFALIVDGIYGTGLDRAVSAVPASAIEAVNRSGSPVLALDVPSGLDCDTGNPLGTCIRAAVTVTFAAMKLGFANPESRAFTGEIVLAGIGAPVDGAPQ